MTEDALAELESVLLGDIDIAMGVFVSKSSSGFGNAVIQVRLYVDPTEVETDEVAVLAPAVDRAIEITWNTWPTRPTAIQLEVVVGAKPADAGTEDLNIRDLADVAALLGLPEDSVHLVIRLSGSMLTSRYGE